VETIIVKRETIKVQIHRNDRAEIFSAEFALKRVLLIFNIKLNISYFISLYFSFL